MGLLGSNFVKALLNKGIAVNVWNRTAGKAKALESLGAQAFEQVQDAVAGATHIHVTLKDDDSVDAVLQTAAANISPGAYIIDHTTTSREGAIRRTAYWKEKGIHYQHAPVFMGPVNARESTGYMLLSGDPAVSQALTPLLNTMTGQILQLGPETGKAAAMKLCGNAFLVCLNFSLRETMAVAKALDVSVNELQALFAEWNPSAQLEGRLRRLSDGKGTNPSWELSMSRKDTGLFLDALGTAAIPPTLLPVVAGVMDRWIADGFGNHDWTVVGRDYV